MDDLKNEVETNRNLEALRKSISYPGQMKVSDFISKRVKPCYKELFREELMKWDQKSNWIDLLESFYNIDTLDMLYKQAKEPRYGGSTRRLLSRQR